MADVETVRIRGESGLVIVHSLPLSESLEKRVAAGEIHVLDPEGEPLPAPEPPKTPRRRSK